MKELTKHFQPKDVIDVVAQLRNLHVYSSEGFRAEEITRYVDEFQETVEDLPEEVRPSEKTLLKLFEEGLSNGNLKDRVFSFHYESLEAAMLSVIDSAFELSANQIKGSQFSQKSF